ncbi:hypothetical protein AB4084_05930, partial [Lysobacter sp. 2RAB21]
MDTRSQGRRVCAAGSEASQDVRPRGGALLHGRRSPGRNRPGRGAICVARPGMAAARRHGVAPSRLGVALLLV